LKGKKIYIGGLAMKIENLVSRKIVPYKFLWWGN